jgi:hypothetical protein
MTAEGLLVLEKACLGSADLAVNILRAILRPDRLCGRICQPPADVASSVRLDNLVGASTARD